MQTCPGPQQARPQKACPLGCPTLCPAGSKKQGGRGAGESAGKCAGRGHRGADCFPAARANPVRAAAGEEAFQACCKNEGKFFFGFLIK